MNFRNKLIWLALFGVLLGFVIKTEAAKRWTIGFEDYKIADPQKIYDINQLEKDLLMKKDALEKQKIEEQNDVQSGSPEGTGAPQDASCQGGSGETCKP